MVYIEDWEEFEGKSKELFLRRPNNTRYSFKYCHEKGLIILKVTDDEVCIKYKTDQAGQLKYIEKLNNLFFRLTSSKQLDGDTLEDEKDDSHMKPIKKGRKNHA